jgi:hypothetical protein
MKSVRSFAPIPESDRRFAAVARISEVNLACYRSFVQPWVRALVTDQGAKWLEPLHPLRMGYELWSDRHPLAAAVHEAAQHVRDHRQPVSEANPFLQLQAQFSTAVEQMLDQFRDCRDQIYAQAFDTLYSLPLVQAMTGQSLHDDAPPRPHPSETPEHRQYLAQELTRLEADIHSGGGAPKPPYGRCSSCWRRVARPTGGTFGTQKNWCAPIWAATSTCRPSATSCVGRLCS